MYFLNTKIIKNSRQFRDCHYTNSVYLQGAIHLYYRPSNKLKLEILSFERTNIDLYTDMKDERAAVSVFETFNCYHHFPNGSRI